MGRQQRRPIFNSRYVSILEMEVTTQMTNNETENSNRPSIVLDGYRKARPIGAQGITRSGRSVYIVALPLSLIRYVLPEVDPDTPIDRNRKVSKERAQKAGQYYLDNPNSWIFPPLLVDMEGTLKFSSVTPIQTGEGLIEFGQLEVPFSSRTDFFILDGQHRVCGINMALAGLEEKLKVEETALKKLQANNSSSLEIQAQQQAIDKTADRIRRFDVDTITVEICTDVDQTMHQNWFVTIADTAKGINASERVRLDEINMTSTLAKEIAEKHPLFKGQIKGEDRVEMRKNLAVRSKSTIYSIANVRDWVRNVAFGVGGKETALQQKYMSRDDVYSAAYAFFDALVTEIPDFKRLVTESITGREFRETSLYSSPTMIRALSSAFYEIVLGSPVMDPNTFKTDMQINTNGLDKFKKLLRLLTPEMEYVYRDNSRRVKQGWYNTTLFRDDAAAPQSGFQDRKKMVELLVRWAESGTIFNPSKPEAENTSEYKKGV